MEQICYFLAIPFDLNDEGLAAGEPIKCPSPAAAIERAKGLWKVLGHSGAAAIARTGYPDTQTTVLERFGNVPEAPAI